MMSRIFQYLFCFLFSLSLQAEQKLNADIRIANPCSLWITPGICSRIAWEKNGNNGTTVAYTIKDFNGKTIQQNKAQTVNNTFNIDLTLSPGYYDIYFPETKQTFGLCALPEYSGSKDHFWGLHTNLYQLSEESLDKRGFIKIINRIGIGSVREGLGSLAKIAISPYEFNFRSNYANLLKAYGENDIEVMNMFEGTPKWMGSHNDTRDLPNDIIAFADAWLVIAAFEQFKVHDIEVWNEADTSLFSGNQPLDIYTAVLKAAYYTTHCHNYNLSIGNAGFANHNIEKSRVDLLAGNNFFDHIDFFTFHYHTTYRGTKKDREENLYDYINLIKAYREILVFNHHPNLPIYNTESGFGHPDATRPSVYWGKESAAAIVFKAIESKACGLKKYFAFYLKPHQETDRFWGMMDEVNSPLRSMACYAYAIEKLSHSEYVGELTGIKSKWNRVFRKKDDAIIVLYQPEIAVLKNLNFQVSRANGLDGRILNLDVDRPDLDDIIYLTLPYSEVKDRLNKNVLSYQLYQYGSAGSKKSKNTSSPIILIRQSALDQSTFTTAGNYTVIDADLPSYPIIMGINNLSAETQKLKVSLSASGSVIASHDVVVPANTCKNVTFTVDLRKYLTDYEYKMFHVEAVDASNTVTSDYCMKIRKEENLQFFLQQYSNCRRLPITDLKNWDLKGVYAGGKNALFQADVTPEGIRFRVKFPPNIDRWCYPHFLLQNISLAEAKGLIIRGKVAKPSSTLIVVGGIGRSYGQATWSILPADNKWHTVFLPINDKNRDQMKIISIGGNSSTLENCFEYNDIYVVY